MSNTKTTSVDNYLGPFIVMVVLMFFVGFFTNINQQFQSPLQAALLSGAQGMKNTLITLITFVWFAAYPAFGGVGSKWIAKFGYKGALVRALMVMVGGLLIYEASVLFQAYAPVEITLGGDNVVPVAFFVFLLGSFIVGGAVTVMQVVINPYLVASKVKGTSDIQRQSIGGAGNSIATTIGPFFVAGVVFGGMNLTEVSVNQLIIPFLALAAMIAILTFIVKGLKLPDIQGTVTKEGEVLSRSAWSFKHLSLGVAAIFFYVGVEVCVGANINLYANSLGGSFAEKAALMASLYWGGMLVGRLIGSVVSNVPAATQLLFTSVIAALLLAAAMITSNPWLLVGTGLFHSVMWPAIFALALNKLGKYTTKGSGLLMIGVIGGGALPFLQGIVADAVGSWDYTWTIVIVAELFLIYYALVGCKVDPADDQTIE